MKEEFISVIFQMAETKASNKSDYMSGGVISHILTQTSVSLITSLFPNYSRICQCPLCVVILYKLNTNVSYPGCNFYSV